MFYLLASGLTRLVLALMSRPELVGADNIPRGGPVLLMANHISWLDPPVVGALMPRRVSFMAKEELFKNWFVRWVVSSYGAFSIRRGESDRQALREALSILESSGVLGMFPEGTRSRIGGLQEAQPGAALLALKSGVPIVPVAIVGTDKVWYLSSLLRRPRFRLVVGRPFKLSKPEGVGRRALASASEEMMLRLAELLPPEMRGAYRARMEEPAMPCPTSEGRVAG